MNDMTLGFVDILLNEYDSASEKDRLKYIQHIHEGLQRVYDLLENLLIWSGTQTNKIVFRPQKLNISEAIRENLSLYETLAQNKNVKLQTEVDNDMIIQADVNFLNTIIRNLVSNAIKYSSKKGIVKIDAGIRNSGAENYFEFSITDNGVGMTKEKMETLFDPEKTSSDNGTNAEKGTGLGLLLCHDFVKKHGGKIWTESDPGKGSRFTFTIPV